MSTVNKTLVGVALITGIVIGLVGWWLYQGDVDVEVITTVIEEEIVTDGFEQQIIGYSVENRAIEAFTYGKGDKKLLFVGGIHGGYEWNSVDLAYQIIDAFESDTLLLPEDTEIAIIPNLNPDGVFKVFGKTGRVSASDKKLLSVNTDFAEGRFNANGVDLNRNFDCKWQPTSSWRGNTVSAGTAAFSEPEAAALRDFVLSFQPDSVIFWHSQANAVYASECENGVLPATLDLMNTYAKAASYQAVPVFEAYPVSGDAEGWLASIHIPAITVELSTHDSLDWERNLSGVKAILDN